MEGKVFHCFFILLNCLAGLRLYIEIQVTLWSCITFGHDPFEVLVDHGQAPAEEIPQVIGKIRVNTLHQGLFAKTGIQAENHLAHEEVSESIRAVLTLELKGFHHISNAFGHLAFVHVPVPVDIKVLKERNARCLQHDRPVYSVWFEDVLGYKMLNGRPEFL